MPAPAGEGDGDALRHRVARECCNVSQENDSGLPHPNTTVSETRCVMWLCFPLVLLLELLLKYGAWRYRTQMVLFNVNTVGLKLVWTYSENPASALGFLSSVPPALRKAMYCAAVPLGVVATISAMQPGRSDWVRIGTACYVFGAIGNLVDRALLSFVVDFLRIEFFGRQIVFNLSDLLIDLGFLVFLCALLRGDVSKEEDKDSVVKE